MQEHRPELHHDVELSSLVSRLLSLLCGCEDAISALEMIAGSNDAPQRAREASGWIAHLLARLEPASRSDVAFRSLEPRHVAVMVGLVASGKLLPDGRAPHDLGSLIARAFPWRDGLSTLASVVGPDGENPDETPRLAS